MKGGEKRGKRNQTEIAGNMTHYSFSVKRAYSLSFYVFLFYS
jgi:hypothetical protein